MPVEGAETYRGRPGTCLVAAAPIADGFRVPGEGPPGGPPPRRPKAVSTSMLKTRTRTALVLLALAAIPAFPAVSHAGTWDPCTITGTDGPDVIQGTSG